MPGQKTKKNELCSSHSVRVEEKLSSRSGAKNVSTVHVRCLFDSEAFCKSTMHRRY